MRPGRLRAERGMALLVVLSIVVWLTLLVVCLALAMRMERRAAHYYAERSRADFYAREGVESVVAALRHATDTNRQWISMPGQIASSTNDIASAETIVLYSGSAPSGDTNAADLNRTVLSDDEKEAVTGVSGQPMNVSWIYVRKDGFRTASASTDPANPVVGRYAYWTDDESSRIDLNTAWKRSGNTSSVNHPSQVNLLAIPGIAESDADAIHASAVNSPFNSPNDARRLGTAIAQTLSSNRFYLSHYAYSSSLNPWGEPKIILTTTTNNLPPEVAAREDYTNYFLDVRDNDADPGWYSGLKKTKVIYQLNRLAALLSTNGWRYSSDSFADKYGDLGSAQLALDVLEYVRSAESTNSVVAPLRVRYDKSTGFSFTGITDPEAINVIVGSTRRPMFSEIGIWMGPLVTVNPSRFTREVKGWLEICLPKSYGVTAADLAARPLAEITFSPKYPDDVTGLDNMPPISFGAVPFASSSYVVNTNSPDCDFVTVSFSRTQTFNFANTNLSRNTNRPVMVWARPTFDDTDPAVNGSGMGSSFWECAPTAFGKSSPPSAYTTNNIVAVPVDPEGPPEGQIHSVQVSDPRVNKFATNWQSGGNTLGNPNFNWNSAVAANPPQDTDSAGNVSRASLAQRQRKGSAGNPRGVVESVAELGRIPTGVGANVPWRTVRFQPTPGSPGLPDWALMDIFAAPYFPTNNAYLYNPKAYTVAGRINLNAQIRPFTNLSRSISLTALFEDSTNITAAQASVAIGNLLARECASGGKLYGGTNGYVSIGEVAEIKGVSDDGEASERRLLGVVDLAAIQGNVFRVYSVGQSLKQTKAGGIVVESEKAVEALVERTEVPGQEPRFRIVYWKVLPL